MTRDDGTPGQARSSGSEADEAIDATLAAPGSRRDPAVDATLAAPRPATDVAIDATLAADASADATLAAALATEGAAPSVRIRPSSPRVDTGPTRTLARGDELGRYVVLSRLGVGGMGEVYAAYDPALDRKIAVKVIQSSTAGGTLATAKDRLLAEAQALAKLSHPHVVAVYDVGTFGDDVYIAMEFVDGTTLTAWCAESARTWSEIVEVFVAAGRGLEAAHAAGLVHRDFKPDNVIIGSDGRVRVIDFGVALATTAQPTRGEQLATTALVGTPAYMAPEQFQAGAIGPHTDQFSFGVALYEALWQRRPFAGATVTQLAVSVCDGQPAPPPDGAAPAWLRAAVMRALAREPGDRHPSMQTLLAAIQPARRRRVWPFAVAAGVLVASATLAFALRGSTDREDVCTGFDRELAGIWDAQRKQDVEQVLEKAAVETWPAVERALDAYAATWVERKQAACRATSVTREQTAAVLEKRMACLDTRRRELDAAVTVIAAGTARSAQALEIATGLRALSGCDNLVAVGVNRPANVDAAALQAIEDGIARARALRLAGEFDAAREQAGKIAERAVAIGWQAAHAQSLVERGFAESHQGDPKAARDTMFEAVLRGSEADDPTSQADAWIALVLVEATGLRQPTEALRWAKYAEVALVKAGGDAERRGMLLHNTASALRALDQHEVALEHQRNALALFENAFGPTHLRVAIERAAIANTLRSLGKLDDSIRDGEAALAMFEQLLGHSHPTLGVALNNLAIAYQDQGRDDLARERLERALAIKELELGPTHVSLAASLNNLASLERNAGRFDAADALWQRAYDIRVAALGSHHADVTKALHAKLVDRASRGMDEAPALAADVVARLRARTDAPLLSTALGVQCELFRRAGRLDAAREACAEAITALGDSNDGNRGVYIYSYAARLAAQRGQPDAAALLDKARAARTAMTRDRRVGDAYVGWATTYVELAAGRREAALTAARAAQEAFVAEGPRLQFYIDDLAKLK